MFCVIAGIPRRAALPGDPGKSSYDPAAGVEGTSEGAGDFRMAGEAAAVRHRKLQNPKPGTSRPHLHFEVPAVCHLAHTKTPQRVGADRPKGAHVGVAPSIKKADDSSNDVAC